MQNLLIVDDAPEVLLQVVAALECPTTNLFTAPTLAAAKEIIKNVPIHLVLLDIYLPDGNGFDLLEEIRNHPSSRDACVLFLTSEGEVRSKVSAFALGAEDYIVKPCNPMELRARVESRLKKALSLDANSGRRSIGPLVFELDKQKVYRRDTGEAVSLSPTEFKLLYFLAKRVEVIRNRGEILTEVWGDHVHVTDRVVDAHICALRKKLGKHGELIRSVSGEGYSFDPGRAA